MKKPSIFLIPCWRLLAGSLHQPLAANSQGDTTGLREAGYEGPLPGDVWHGGTGKNRVEIWEKYILYGKKWETYVLWQKSMGIMGTWETPQLLIGKDVIKYRQTYIYTCIYIYIHICIHARIYVYISRGWQISAQRPSFFHTNICQGP